MKLRYITIALALVLLAVSVLTGRQPVYAAGELLGNGSFASVKDGLPEGWSKDGYRLDEAVTKWSVEKGSGGDPASFVRVSNAQPNDARWLQRAAVEPDKLYKLSALVRASDVPAGGTGVNLSVLGVMETSDSLYDTAGSWQTVEVYGKTGASQTELDVLLRVGGYGSEATGTGEFANVSLMEAAEAPEGAKVISFDPASAPPAGGGEETGAPKAPGFLIPFSVLSGILFLGLLWMAWSALYSKQAAGGWANSLRMQEIGSSRRTLWIVLGAGLLLRLALAPTMQGHPVDFPDFAIWADRAYSVGLNGFFSDDVFADYPPGYIYVLWVLGMLKSVFGLAYGSGAAIILVKLPALIADLITAWLLYDLARSRFGTRLSVFFAALYVFSPAIWLDSALWAQVDSVMTLLVLLAVRSLSGGKYAPAAAWLAVAVLVKPQAVLFLPLLLFALLRTRRLSDWLKAAGAGIATALIMLLPFAVGREPLWIVHHYQAMFQSYPYATLNAFNVYGLFGLNGIDTAKTWLGLSLSTWGNVGAIVALAVMGLICWKKGREGMYLAAFAGALFVFLLKTGMHERYLYPALAFALAAFLVSGSKRLLALYGGLTLTVLANTAPVLKDAIEQNFYRANGDSLMVSVSALQLAAGALTLFIVWQLLRGGTLGSLALTADGRWRLPDPAPEGAGARAAEGNRPGSSDTEPADYEDEISSVPKRKEWLPVLLLAAVYAVMMFWQLGDAKAPVTPWLPDGQNREVTVQLQGEAKPVDHIMLYAGIGSGTVNVSLSADGVNFGAPAEQKLDGGTVFQWKSVGVDGQLIKAVRITGTPGVTLYEAGVIDAEGRTMAFEDSSGSTLFDEQKLVPAQPSYRNSMYFDEIYHARTAFEHLYRIEPYETTHPPLGKVIIMAGISIFGMNPFGWRVMGGIAGILLIPAMYALARGLFRSRKAGLLAAGLILLDFMPLVQSRIGTVDTYAVLFIIMSYHFMNRFVQRNKPGTALSRVLLPFMLSGVFFGLGASVKWVGVYSGAGLAVLFFWSMYRRWKSSQNANANETGEKRVPLLMIGAGFLFFVGVPAVIYVLTYIPFMLVPGPGHGLINVVKFQKFMYDYHSKLVATHPFSSTWWEWPIIRRPIWYYGGSGLEQGQIASIMSLGNPLIWWAGIPCAIAAFAAALRKKHRAMQIVSIGLLSQYLPWVGIPRLTFIYHYYATVPFLILCIVYVLMELPDRFGRQRAKAVTWGYLGLAALLLVMFYPVLTGLTISREYADTFLKWFDSWTFFS
ncbi:glycosyltransferase family 39 protein [Paenibacillus pasadenensis]|uniref:glycosyltransferase family 39 protein n=1 Tax=Paenibacillus pasadenensis TaxID=217090 RepID=UPI002041265A|nr:glycosyltransferase family 39 protein [Paenibacillus pasadenensis]MCM3746897.1 glycosyltransferase family 39 protein [Paenibacillus pasadenensis]